VDPVRRGLARELLDRGHGTAPGSRSIVVAGERQLVSASRALLKCVVAIALEHELRRPPNVDLRDQIGRLMKSPPGPPMTLGNAANAKVRLIVSCKACRHQVEADPAEMVARYGADTSVLDWRKRLGVFRVRWPRGRFCRDGHPASLAGHRRHHRDGLVKRTEIAELCRKLTLRLRHLIHFSGDRAHQAVRIEIKGNLNRN